MVMSENNQTRFRSLVYRSAMVYNFTNQRAYEFYKRFKLIGEIIKKEKAKVILDLPCGTGFLTRYLEKNITYIGWDLNHRFLAKIKKDKKRGRVKPKKVILSQKNIFDFDSYPSNVDAIVLCDILHHVIPNHKKLVENAKKKAKIVIICEPIAVKPDQIKAKDWIARTTLFILKHFPEKLYRLIDFFFADNDGINRFENRLKWSHTKESLKKLYNDFGIEDKNIYHVGDELLGVWKRKNL